MRLTIRRVGGHLPTLRPTRVTEVDELDPALKTVLLQFMRQGPRVTKAPHPEAFVYSFELEGAGQGERTSASFEEIPEELRVLLPAAKPAGG